MASPRCLDLAGRTRQPDMQLGEPPLEGGTEIVLVSDQRLSGPW
jgi:hypothetical protein